MAWPTVESALMPAGARLRNRDGTASFATQVDKAEARKRPEPVYAKGSMEWQHQQEALRAQRQEEAQRQEQQGDA